MSEIIWKERKKNCLGLPWTFTVYSLDNEKLYTTKGFFSKTFDEIKLYRITDFSVHMSFFQRIFGLGTIHICSADTSSPEYDIKNIYNAVKVKDLISQQVEYSKDKSGVKASEFIANKPHPSN